MKVLALTGMPGSGKGELAQCCKISNIPVIRMGDMVLDELEARGIPQSPETVGQLASEMRAREGMDVWARRTADYIEKYVLPRKPAVIIIDGVRSMEEIYCFKNRFGKELRILAVHASPSTRHERMVRRGRKDDGSLQQALERDKRELSWGIGNVIAMADYMLINEGSIIDLRNGFDAILKKVLSE